MTDTVTSEAHSSGSDFVGNPGNRAIEVENVSRKCSGSEKL